MKKREKERGAKGNYYCLQKKNEKAWFFGNKEN